MLKKIEDIIGWFILRFIIFGFPFISVFVLIRCIAAHN